MKLNASEPLGLPRGSVRALLAIMVVGAFVGRLALGFAIDATLTGICVLVLRDYFMSREAEASRTPNEAPLEEPLV